MSDQPIDADKLRAQFDLNDILALRNNLPFNRYWMKEPAREIAKITASLTSNRMSEADQAALLGELKAWRRVRSKLDADEAGKRSILGLAGDAKIIPALPDSGGN